jgi:hypothetical protein
MSVPVRRTMIRYKVKAEKARENEGYVREVFAALARTRPQGLRYASFKTADGVSFVHIVSHENSDGRNLLTELPEFRAFTAAIRERCEEGPVAVDLEEIGAYGLFGK